MKSHLKIYHIPMHTEKWYEFRKNGIGGSEIGTILGLDEYNTRMRIFAEKVGLEEPWREDNEFMFWGREHEDKIADIWKYWDGTRMDYIKNFTKKKLIRKCRNVNGYVVNPDYPWLFASLDRVINKEGGINMITGESLETECVLECKTLSYWVARKWETGIPVAYLAQIHQYMLILECDYAEIAILRDGNKFEVETIQKNEALCERIISISKAFWYNRVLPAKEAKIKMDKADMEGQLEEAEKYDGMIQHLEPDPDTTEAYKKYMDERFVKEREMIQGTIDLYELCKRYVLLLKVKNKINVTRTYIKNCLIKHMDRYGSELIDFGSMGRASWTLRKGAKWRVFGVNIKEIPSDEIIEREFEKIDQNVF